MHRRKLINLSTKDAESKRTGSAAAAETHSAWADNSDNQKYG